MTDRTAPTANPAARRFRADFPEGTVVFLIGMRINRLRSVRAWFPVFRAMPRMLSELAQDRDLGLLHGWSTWSGRNIVVIQYWESMDKLMAYAAASDREHLPAWRAFNGRARTTGDAVGIWHEAYEVNPEHSHLVYNAMPPFGMGQATTWKPASGMPPQAVRSRLATGANDDGTGPRRPAQNEL